MTEIDLLKRYVLDLEQMVSGYRQAVDVATELLGQMTTDVDARLRFAQQVHQVRATRDTSVEYLESVRALTIRTYADSSRAARPLLEMLEILCPLNSHAEHSKGKVSESIATAKSELPSVAREEREPVNETARVSLYDGRWNIVHDRIAKNEKRLGAHLADLLYRFARREWGLLYTGPSVIADKSLRIELGYPDDTFQPLIEEAVSCGWLKVQLVKGRKSKAYKLVDGCDPFPHPIWLYGETSETTDKAAIERVEVLLRVAAREDVARQCGHRAFQTLKALAIAERDTGFNGGVMIWNTDLQKAINYYGDATDDLHALWKAGWIGYSKMSDKLARVYSIQRWED